MTLDLPVPGAFPAFPYETPYGIQQDLMRHLYSAIEGKQVTIVESPTGTGKTLSLLCASLTWLLDDKERARKGELSVPSGSKEPDWVTAQTIERRRRLLEEADSEYEEKLAKARKKESVLRKMAAARERKRAKVPDPAHADGYSDEDEFLPDDESTNADGDDNLSPAVRALMARFHKTSSGDASEAEPICTKIYYASRTHSQLTQTLPEMRRLKLSVPSSYQGEQLHTPSSPPSPNRGKRKSAHDEGATQCSNTIRSVALGSRKQLCIHDDLRKRTTDLDEACRQMLNDKQKRCPHLPPVGEDAPMLDFRDQILASPKDIEELAEAGRLSSTCPYFGSRAAIPQAQLVTLPYNLLLQESAREALGINLKDQILVIDEAHNLIPTLLSLSSVHLPHTTLAVSLQQLAIYYARFRTRLSATHALHLKRLVALLKELQAYGVQWKAEVLGKSANGPDARQEVVTPGELVRRLGRKVEGVNLLDINGYLRSSKIARKINGYSDKLSEKAAKNDPTKLARLRRGGNPPLHTVESFIISLTEANDDGRITLSLSGESGQEQVDYKYQLLNPATHFRQVLDDARCVILAGGTMSPMSDYTMQLLAHLPPTRISTFSCGHIIPPKNLRAVILGRGPRGSDLEFKFGNRDDPALVAELGQMLLNFVNVVPAGMVVFLPSYAFLNTVMAAWSASGTLAKLNAKKKVFSEPQGSEVEPVLRDYAAEIRSSGADGKKGGAVLFAVVGAKLSEGLNFTDDLARAVVVVGLPFPNLKSPELQERMKYVKRTPAPDSRAGGRDPAMELYENMAMNAINQSIGRAIRHGGDWAALILVDRRYGSPRIRGKLPKWIAESLCVTDSFGGGMKELGTFYRQRRM